MAGGESIYKVGGFIEKQASKPETGGLERSASMTGDRRRLIRASLQMWTPLTFLNIGETTDGVEIRAYPKIEIAVAGNLENEKGTIDRRSWQIRFSRSPMFSVLRPAKSAQTSRVL